MANLNLVHSEGRSEAAAKLHSLEEMSTPLRTTGRAVTAAEVIPKNSIKDYWAERGEHGRWVRIHVEPRSDKFDPWTAERGPGRKTKLQATRRTQGIFEDGKSFNYEDDWEQKVIKEGTPVMSDVDNNKWVGKTIFLVDRRYSREYGTDQRRQRTTAANKPNQPTK
jgi:hypothetical protein